VQQEELLQSFALQLAALGVWDAAEDGTCGGSGTVAAGVGAGGPCSSADGGAVTDSARAPRSASPEEPPCLARAAGLSGSCSSGASSAGARPLPAWARALLAADPQELIRRYAGDPLAFAKFFAGVVKDMSLDLFK
jgi:hypothetical protein